MICMQAAHFMECGHVVDQFTEWALLAQSEVIDVFRAYRQDTANCTTLASRTAYLTKVCIRALNPEVFVPAKTQK